MRRLQQQNNGYHQPQPNGYQNQLGMMNPQMMNNQMMGHMNNQIPMPNMPIHPQFFMHQQQQLQQFGLPNPYINQFLPNLNLMSHSLQPNFFRPPLGPSAFSSLNSFNPQLRPQPQPRPQVLPQGQSAGNFNGSNTKGNDFRNNFTKHHGFQLHGSKKKSGFNKEHKGKRNYNKMSSGSGVDSIAKEKKRPYVCFYTPKEIQLWREARLRNFPTKHNIEKKSKKNVSEEEAKLRRQQLQEVLAKQAELGVEVAEVPSHYLSGTEEQANGNRGDNNDKPFQYKDGRRGRSQNNKRRHGEKDKFNKKPRSEDQNASQESSITMREPTLLEKLLSADMKRDKSRLLQVFRFMVMNSFFKDQLPLKLPLVMVEETGYEHVREDEHVSEDEDEV